MLNSPEIVAIQAYIYITVYSPTGGYNQMSQSGSQNNQPKILAIGTYLNLPTAQCHAHCFQSH